MSKKVSYYPWTKIPKKVKSTMTEDNSIRHSLPDLMRFLSTPEHPITSAEFNEFWRSCSDQEREEFRSTELPRRPKDGPGHHIP